MGASRLEVLVVGLGAIGSIYAYVLDASGLVNVSAVARSNFDLIKNQGLHIKSEKFGTKEGWRPHHLYSSIGAAAVKRYDYVIVTSKCVPEVLPTSKILEPLLCDVYTSAYGQPTYVLFQNGFDIERELYERLRTVTERPSVISAALHIFTNQAGAVVNHNAYEELYLGVYRPDDYTTTVNSVEEQYTLDRIGRALKRGGSKTNIVPEVQRYKFDKNMRNVVFSGLCVLTGYPIMALFRPPPQDGQSYEVYVHPAHTELIEEYSLGLAEDIFEDCVRIGHAMGIPDSFECFRPGAGRALVEMMRKMFTCPDASTKPSTLIDLEKGAPMEIEPVWGSVVRLAKRLEVAAPHVKMMYSIMLVKQNQIMRKRACA
ncbi:6-phosphogluconate dehydrogenase C-terminal domain-like protein [Cylindrobasidium torrendii FP15055 ss-10]|uniref:6-phosphogluconate dehydrogenase C-terminal domain-like protein n=1 Tax=Cylindrobasidium torrendii FP15055 ss-10 TaxID=1314674 RepID=A0A0D7BJT4_9AGAR|nr:6-phosphogluconate dehydrogenase C-terminal domain-like protein [Cylindrobasidium torrendii FP15055 ss-10]